jgi:hypothetical protein
MRGRYIRSVDRQVISEEDMFRWLWRGDITPDTDSERIAVHQALQTKCHATKILKTGMSKI